MTDAAAGRVSFHVRLYTSVHLPTWTKLVMTDVISNHGNAYSNVTGDFVAPYNATYFFIASTAVFGTNHVANFFLMVNLHTGYSWTHRKGLMIIKIMTIIVKYLWCAKLQHRSSCTGFKYKLRPH